MPPVDCTCPELLPLLPNIPPDWTSELPNNPPVGCEEGVLANIPPDDFTVPNTAPVLFLLLPNIGCDASSGRFPPFDCVVWIGAFSPLPTKAILPDLTPLDGDEPAPNVKVPVRF
jgi:hypothetical protein